jgi:hypothetical protein
MGVSIGDERPADRVEVTVGGAATAGDSVALRRGLEGGS